MLHKLIPLYCRLPEVGDLSLKHITEFIFKDNLYFYIIFVLMFMCMYVCMYVCMYMCVRIICNFI